MSMKSFQAFYKVFKVESTFNNWLIFSEKVSSTLAVQSYPEATCFTCMLFWLLSANFKHTFVPSEKFVWDM